MKLSPLVKFRLALFILFIIGLFFIPIRPTNPLDYIAEAQSNIIDSRDAIWTDSTTAYANLSDVTGIAQNVSGTLVVDTQRSGCTILWLQPVNNTNTDAGTVSFDATINNGASWVQASGSNGPQTYVQSNFSPHTNAFNGQEAGWRFPS